MNKITVKQNGGGWSDTFHCQVIEESESELNVLINDELTQSINKSKIIENVDID